MYLLLILDFWTIRRNIFFIPLSDLSISRFLMILAFQRNISALTCPKFGKVGQTLERILPLPNLIMAFGRVSVVLVIKWIFGVFSCLQFHTLSRKNFIITWLCTEIKGIGICFFSFFLLFYLFLEALCLNNLWRKMKLLYHFDFIL